jgi:phage host-nuclease inhibitor protein Gam
MSAKKSVKVKVEAPKIQTRGQFEEATGHLQRAVLERQQINTALDLKLNETRQEFLLEQGDTLAELDAEIALQEKQILAWAKANKETEFNGRQSLETKFAVVKFFKGQFKCECKSKWNWDKVLARIKECSLTKRFIRTKEEPNKEALIAAREEVIQSTEGQFTVGDLGVRVFQEESFTIEVKAEPTLEPQPVLEEAR